MGHLTAKSDVYSFGVVLLEILTRQRSIDKKRPSGKQNLVSRARPCLADKRKLYQLALELHHSLKGVQKNSQLSYNCISRDPKCRPSMDEVVKAMTPLQDLNDLAILNYDLSLSAIKPNHTCSVKCKHKICLFTSASYSILHLQYNKLQHVLIIHFTTITGQKVEANKQDILKLFDIPSCLGTRVEGKGYPTLYI
ncbi:putative protein kinase RLK-Pelle-RLCK-VIIa-2 family [Lupinus albus]|uniref:Protein kinase domain-containing protein n=1 Tax=Lupinus albus TaxID=3870 RepID=A0A6A4Q8R2_LUPAL|nr:putative protein kinase RLK-Pelle-RLCK-VIIa-2 family [Lupinus albus]